MKFKKTHTSGYFAYLVFSLGFILIIGFSLNLQIINGSKYKNTAINFVVQQEEIPVARGLILDRQGRVIADNKEVYDVFIKFNSDTINIKEDLKSSIPEDLISISNFSEFDTYVTSQQDIKLFGNIDSAQLERLNSLTDKFETYIQSKFVRDYKYPESFAHVVGYTGLVNSEDVENGYKANEYIGRYRIEKQYEDLLKGESGQTIYSDLSQIQYQGKAGGNVYLTIDAEWQNKIYELLSDYNQRYSAAGGAGVVIDTATGEVISLVSYPGFDTNKFISGISDEEYKNLELSYTTPLIDKVISSAFAPGSIFKIITSYSLLDNGIIDANTQYFSNQCIRFGGGYDFCEYGRNFYGTMELERALYKSSNLFFCNFLLELQATQGIYKFVEDAKAFGIGKKTNINLDGETLGNMDSPEYKLSVTSENWFDGDSCNAAIGQGAIAVTPMQMANALNIFENKGNAPVPQVIYKTTSSDGEVVETLKPKFEKSLEMSDQTYNSITKGLVGVAYSPGSATYWFLHNLPNNIKAKTGTAEATLVINGQVVEGTHSWIVGSFDYKNKKYSFAFFQEMGGGGYYVTPLLRDFLSYINSK